MFVIFSVTVLSLASGAWLLAQLGLAIGWAMVGALAIYATLLTVHVIARRSFAALDRAAAARAGDEMDWVEADPAENVSPRGMPAGDFLSELADVLESGHAPRRDDGTPPGHWDIAPTPAGSQASSRASSRADQAHELPEPRAADAFDFRPLRAPSLGRPTAELALELEDPLGPDRQAPDLPTPDLQAPDLAKHEPRFEDTSPSEMNVEIIQELIKKLADELNGPIQRTPEPAPETAAASHTDAMIGRSVAALETTARSMRDKAAKPAAARPAAYREARPPTGNVPSWWPTAAEAEAQPKAATPARKPPALNPLLARIAEAVAAERIEVLLEPIHALAEGRTRHFEVSVRLLTADGAALEQCDFARAAQGSGLMPRIDAERMLRAARVARRLGERGRHGSVLSAIAGESLTDTEFLGTTAAHKGTDGRMNLVLSFAQCEVRTFTAGHAEALERLASAGFGFALEEVTDLDMDFGTLKAMGFEFVKLDAPVFLEGLAAPGGRVPASDICRHLSDYGLTLIVGRIEDDWLLARILGFGVLFGKGTLFGGPKLVKPEVVAEPAAA